MFEIGVNEDMRKNVVDFDIWEINEQEGGASSLISNERYASLEGMWY